MGDFDAAKVLGHVIHDALEPAANDYQQEARAVIAAIQADTQVGALLRQSILGLDESHIALWDRLDKTAVASAQNIEWEAPRTAAIIREDGANA